MRRFSPLSLAALLAYLLFWPVPIEPVVWQAPTCPGPGRLAGAPRLGANKGNGQEDVTVNAAGTLTVTGSCTGLNERDVRADQAADP